MEVIELIGALTSLYDEISDVRDTYNENNDTNEEFNDMLEAICQKIPDEIKRHIAKLDKKKKKKKKRKNKNKNDD